LVVVLDAYFTTQCVKVNLVARNTSQRETRQMAAPRRVGECRIDTARVDQWLWSVRLTKTRADAAAACRAGHVKVNGKTAKPSSPIKVGDRVEARLAQRERVAVVERVIVKRVGAVVAVECYDDQSPPPPERTRPDAQFAVRDPGAGRPTKRDRRQIDKLRGRR